MIFFLWRTAATSVCLAFNIDATATRIFTTEQKDFFQNKVLQLLSDKNNGWVSKLI